MLAEKKEVVGLTYGHVIFFSPTTSHPVLTLFVFPLPSSPLPSLPLPSVSLCFPFSFLSQYWGLNYVLIF
jgi:hypothetical protein